MIKFDIAVIGAGLAGLIAAERLRRAGRQVLVVDKARGPGGRLATRRGDDSVRMDHGCQYLVEDDRDELATLVQGPDREFMASWGPVHSRRTSMGADHYPIGSMWHVGMPTMSAIPKSLAAELEIRLRTRVTRLNRVGDDWQLLDDQGGTVASACWVVCDPIPAGGRSAWIPWIQWTRSHVEGDLRPKLDIDGGGAGNDDGGSRCHQARAGPHLMDRQPEKQAGPSGCQRLVAGHGPMEHRPPRVGQG